MDFKKIIILLKKGCEIDSATIDKIFHMSKGAQIKVLAFDETRKEEFDGFDLVITIGGDGTFVKAGNLIEDAFIIGINSKPDKSEGALTELTIDEIDRLKNIFDGDFDVALRQRAKVRLNGKVLDEHALNEVYVGAISQFHSSRYVIKFRGHEEEHRSSGVIVSTGTGSPAWFYSAGGEVFHHGEEKLSFVVREPYFGKRVFVPKIIRGDIKKGEKLVIESKRDSGGIIAINDSVYDFNDGDAAEIELSDKPLKVIKLR